MTLPFYDAETIAERFSLTQAMDALEAELRGGLDPESDGARLFADAPDGEFLIMPAQGKQYTGIKVLTSAPNNPARGLPKIQGVYVLYSSDTLAPVAVLEGSSLTIIRTSAVTVSAVRQLAALAQGTPDDVGASPRILVFGAGLQAAGHIRAAAASFPGATFEVIGRSPEGPAHLIESLPEVHITDRSAEAETAIPQAQIILCVTTSTTPIFDSSLVSPSTIIGAAGTHGLDARELDDALIARSDIVVEGRASARAENGNLISLQDEDWPQVANLADLARGNVQRTPGRPIVYTGVGMPWEDLVCASAIHEEMT